MKQRIIAMFALVAISTSGAPLPTERQVKRQQLEVIGMVTFSTITSYGKEWDYGDEDPAKFNPTEIDARRNVRTAKSAGIKGLAFVAKHHGGFYLWPLQYPEYSVDGIRWKKAIHFQVTGKVIPMQTGESLPATRRERPFVFVEDDQPRLLIAATMLKGGDTSIFIPLQSPSATVPNDPRNLR